MRAGAVRRALALAAICAAFGPAVAAASEAQSVPVVEASPAPAAEPADDEIDPAEPDFVVVNMPTQARMPRGGWGFRVTHRFNRPLNDDNSTFGDLAGDLFGFDGGAQIGLELRYGIARGTQIGVHRTSDRTISLFAQRDIVRAAGNPFGAAAYAAVDGRDNFQEDHAAALGLLLSRRLGERGAVYALPAVVLNATSFSGGEGETALLLALGARIRFAGAAALLVEFTPRLDGVDGEFRHPLSIGVEKSVGGHAFQISVSNGFGTMLSQTAQGAVPGDPWYLGFNISRKFY